MLSEMSWPRAAACAAVASLLATACGVSPDSDSPTVAYRDAESVQSLEVPPDLTRPSGAGGLDVPGEGGDVRGRLLPDFDGVRFVRAGVNSWLEMDEVAPEDLWPRIDGFLRSQGLTIARREPALGIVETGWAERFDSPQRGGIGGFINNLLGFGGSSNVRDKYILRLERMDGAGTRVFVTHRSAQEVATGETPRQTDEFMWSRRMADPAIEAEMTRRLLVHLGVSEPGAEGIVSDAVDALGVTPRYVVEGGAARLMVDDTDLRRVFARVGDALGKIGASVRSTEFGRGVYVFDWVPPPEVAGGGGFLGLFGRDEDEPVELQLQLDFTGEAVRIKAADAEGVRRSGAVHRALLRRLAVALGANPETVQRAEEADSEDAPPSGAQRRGNAP